MKCMHMNSFLSHCRRSTLPSNSAYSTLGLELTGIQALVSKVKRILVLIMSGVSRPLSSRLYIYLCCMVRDEPQHALATCCSSNSNSYWYWWYWFNSTATAASSSSHSSAPAMLAAAILARSTGSGRQFSCKLRCSSVASNDGFSLKRLACKGRLKEAGWEGAYLIAVTLLSVAPFPQLFRSRAAGFFSERIWTRGP